MPRQALSSDRLLLSVLALGAFTTTLNTTLLSPLLKPIAVDFSVSDAAAGQLATLTAACAGVTALVAAPWLDWWSRGAWLRIESILLGLGTFISIVAPSFAWLFVGRALAGIGGSVIFALCLAAVGDRFADPGQRNRAIGVVGMAATLGAVAGLPLMAQLAAKDGWRWAMAAMIPCAFILFLGSATLPNDGCSPAALPRSFGIGGYSRLLANRATASLLAAMIVLCLVWYGWLIYFGAYARTVLHVGADELSLLFLVGGGAEIVANSLLPALLKRCAVQTVIFWAAGALSVNLIGTGVIYVRPWTLFPFIGLASLSSVLLFTSVSILLLDTQPTLRGGVMALQSASFEFGGALGAASVGFGLSVLGGYAAAYRLLGVALPLLLIPLVLVGHSPTHSAQSRGETAEPRSSFAEVGRR